MLPVDAPTRSAVRTSVRTSTPAHGCGPGRPDAQSSTGAPTLCYKPPMRASALIVDGDDARRVGASAPQSAPRRLARLITFATAAIALRASPSLGVE